MLLESKILLEFYSNCVRISNFVRILFEFAFSFIKNKYPRNRQWSKNIIYFGVWLNIVLVYFSYIFCYHYSFILNYIWWLTLILFYFISLRSILTFNIIKNWVISIIKLYISFRIKKKDKDKNKDKHAY